MAIMQYFMSLGAVNVFRIMSLGAVNVFRINSMAFVVQTAAAFFMALSTFSNYRTRSLLDSLCIDCSLCLACGHSQI